MHAYIAGSNYTRYAQQSGQLEIDMSAASLSPGSRVCKIGKPAPAAAPIGDSQQQKSRNSAACSRSSHRRRAQWGEWSGSENAWGHCRLCRN